MGNLCNVCHSGPCVMRHAADAARHAPPPIPALGRLVVPEFQRANLPAYDYTMGVKVKLLLYTISSYVLLALAGCFAAKPALWLLRIWGTWAPALGLMAVVYVAASF